MTAGHAAIMCLFACLISAVHTWMYPGNSPLRQLRVTYVSFQASRLHGNLYACRCILLIVTRTLHFRLTYNILANRDGCSCRYYYYFKMHGARYTLHFTRVILKTRFCLAAYRFQTANALFN